MIEKKLPNHPEKAKAREATELSDEQLDNVSGGETVQAPRDVATGQASGKRQHGVIR